MPVNFGLVGLSLSHSFSKDFFTNKFEKLGLTNHFYQLYELKNIVDIHSLIANDINLLGLNVTIPYKIAVLDHLQELSTEAKEIQAVNTIKIIRTNNTTLLKGYNTDVYGFEMSIKPFLESHHQRALVLGDGGASKAVQFVLKKLGIDFYVVSRSPKVNQLKYDDLRSYVVKHHFFIINTTPLGMSPHENACVPFVFDDVTDKHFFVDLIYNPVETLFLKQAKDKGARIMNGMNMLHLQAEKAFEIWKNNE
jgi:shikimate dehydrogenase